MFIVLEGLDGAGKSTQIKRLTRFFEERGRECAYLHFPRFNAPVYGELIARFLRGEFGSASEVNPYLVALIYAGDRADAATMIRQWLDAGKVVILDRYVYSNVGYQCAKLEAGKQYDEVLAIGPIPMMKFVCKTTEPFGVHTSVSLNPIMVDGTGMCGGCRVTVGGETKFACVDGPEFDGHKVDFAELMSRNSLYRGREAEVTEKHACHFSKYVLGAENLVAAAECLDPGEDIVEGLDADAHGVGEIQHPGIGADVPDLPGKFLIIRHGAHSPQDAAGAGGITDGLVNAEALRRVDVAAHLAEGAGEDGDDDEVRTLQRVLQTGADGVFKAGSGGGILIDPRADGGVAPGGLQVDVVQSDLTGQTVGDGEVGHEHPGPLLGAAADIGDLDVLLHRNPSGFDGSSGENDRIFGIIISDVAGASIKNSG